MKPWFVYIVKCNDSTFYTGISNNVSKRVEKHNQGQGAKYTKGRLPVKLIYQEQCINRSIASKREYQIKQLSKKEKQALINNFNK